MDCLDIFDACLPWITRNTCTEDSNSIQNDPALQSYFEGVCIVNSIWGEHERVKLTQSDWPFVLLVFDFEMIFSHLGSKINNVYLLIIFLISAQQTRSYSEHHPKNDFGRAAQIDSSTTSLHGATTSTTRWTSRKGNGTVGPKEKVNIVEDTTIWKRRTLSHFRTCFTIC